MRQLDDQPERDYPPVKPLPENIRLIGGTLGWSILLWMFYHPFDGYLLPEQRDASVPSGAWYPRLIVRMIQLGVVGMNATETGYTLTAQGRLLVAEELERQLKVAKLHKSSYHAYDEEDLAWAAKNDPNADELWSRIADTY